MFAEALTNTSITKIAIREKGVLASIHETLTLVGFHFKSKMHHLHHDKIDNHATLCFPFGKFIVSVRGSCEKILCATYVYIAQRFMQAALFIHELKLQVC